jgi:hypothetical protein
MLKDRRITFFDQESISKVRIQETYGDLLTITKELSLNAKKRHLPRIKLDRLSFVTLFSEKK